MKFGLFGGATAAAAPSQAASERLLLDQPEDSHSYGAFIDAIVEAESLGFHSIFLVEHHFTGEAQVSAPMNLLTYLAAKTSTIRLGTGVIVIPWHNPVLLAEQAATVDVLSNGRFDFGVGKGYRPREFEGFCISIQESAGRFEESMTLIKKSLSSNERFSFHSDRWNFEDIVVEPPPVQKPHPPMWLAAGRPDSLRYAANGDYSLLLDQFATFDVTLERFAIYREAVEASGKSFDPMNVAVARGMHIIRSEEEREIAINRRMAALDHMNQMAKSNDAGYQTSMTSDPDLRKAAEQGTLIGTPEEIIDRLKQLQDGGVEYILLAGVQMSPPQMRAFAEEITPAFT
ncbi:MAG: LLM class flavin-dependent oxidoreductase [Alphaproteobacteria bacterium]|jgi:alkanesulfonate monooxygenase SsuD/methylene tetrahydromethanopterin reductase-like flavin-dependent oxidoreductase (luciferase family)